MSIVLRQLQEICSRTIERVDPRSKPDGDFWYIDISSIDSTTKTIANPTLTKGKSASVRARQLLRENDVLVSTTRPNLNAVATVPEKYDGQIGSTGFCVLRGGEELDSEYLYYYTRSSRFVDSLTTLVQGALYPAVTDKQVYAQDIPWVPVEKQRQIAARLKAQLAEVDKARQAAEVQLRDADALVKAIHREIENEIFTDAEIRQFGSYVRSYRNGFGKRPKEGERGPIVLRIADVSSGTISIANPRHGEVSEKEAETYKLENGDLLFIRVNGAKEIVGRCCVVDGRVPQGTIFNDHLIRVQIADKLDPDFARLCVSLPRARQLIEEVASTSAGQLTINQQLLNRLEIPAYSISDQKKAVEKLQSKIEQLAVLRESVSTSLTDINIMSQKILAQAFEI